MIADREYLGVDEIAHAGPRFANVDDTDEEARLEDDAAMVEG